MGSDGLEMKGSGEEVNVDWRERFRTGADKNRKVLSEKIHEGEMEDVSDVYSDISRLSKLMNSHSKHL